AVLALLVVQRPAHDVRARVQHARAAVHVEAATSVVGRVAERDRLRAGRAVHVRQLEPDELDAVGLPPLEDLVDRGHSTPPPGVVTARPTRAAAGYPDGAAGREQAEFLAVGRARYAPAVATTGRPGDRGPRAPGGLKGRTAGGPDVDRERPD